jgi:hypothetical protein
MHKCLWCLVAVLVMGCGKDEESSGDSGAPGPTHAPEDCIADEEVCATFSADWSEDDATAHCASLGGAAGACPADETGICTLEDGLSYHLYVMPSMEGESYCEWLDGTWAQAE